MNEQQLKTGQAILKLIQKTEDALNILNPWIQDASLSVGGVTSMRRITTTTFPLAPMRMEVVPA